VTVKPNFIHVGPGKAGSTWIHETLSAHPDVHLTAAKDLYFFSREYDRGLAWYLGQFRSAPAGARIVGEVCPGYLWFPQAATRIRECLGDEVRIMVTLRNPVARAFSAYLYELKNGLTGVSFGQALDAFPSFIDEGRYRTHLDRYLAEFGAERIHVTLFDDLQSDPQSFLDDTTDWLGIARQRLTAEALMPRLPASRARSALVARGVKEAAEFVRRHNGANLVGSIKRSAAVQSLLYQPLGERLPEVPGPEAARIKELLQDEIKGLEAMFGIPVQARWGWS
jgi:hypothetical protein